jgi:hypothetical protein
MCVRACLRARQVRDVCDRLELMIEEAIMRAAAEEAEVLHLRLGPLMHIIDKFS